MQFTLSSISTNKNAATTFTNYFTKESSVFLLFLFSFLICHLIVTVSAISALDLLSLSFLTYANGFVFSRTPICKTSRNDGCREYLTGVLTLRNEESFQISGTVKGDELKHDPFGYGIKVTISKSPVLFVYDLKYEIDVFSDFEEDIFEYAYSKKMYHVDYGYYCLTSEDLEDCDKDPAVGPDGTPLNFHAGRCCWCRTSTFYSSPGPPRSNLKCGQIDAIFRGLPYLSKHCPRIIGPWYSGMSIGPWRWDFTLRVLVEWYTPGNDDDPENDLILSPTARAAEYACLNRAVSSTVVDLDQLDNATKLNDSQENRIAKELNNENENLRSAKQRRSLEERSDTISQDDTIRNNDTHLLNIPIIDINQKPIIQSSNEKFDKSFIARVVRDCRRERTYTAGLRSAEFLLNISTPQIWNDEFKLEVKIAGSSPQMEAFPPPLSDRYLFIPTYPEDHPVVMASTLTHGCGFNNPESEESTRMLFKGDKNWNNINGTNLMTANQTINEGKLLGQTFFDDEGHEKKRTQYRPPQCLSESMLVPSELVDLTGNSCNRIGTSTMTWGNGGGTSFCDSLPGHCMANQLGKLKKSDDLRINDGLIPRFRIGPHSLPGFPDALPRILSDDPEAPIDLQSSSKTYQFAWTYPYEHVTTLEIELAADNIVWIQTSAPGEIYDVKSDLGCKPLSSQPCIADVFVKNTGTTTSRYIVSIPYCIDAMTGKQTSRLKQPSPIAHVVKANRTAAFRFVMRSNSDLTGYYTCKTALSDHQGRRLDQGLFNMSFFALSKRFQGQQPVLWAPTVGVTMVDAGGNSVSLLDFLGGISGPLRAASFYNAQCNCSLYNVFCLVANFRGCVARAKGIIWSALTCIGLVVALYVCAPSASFCIKSAGRRMRSMRKRQQVYLSTIDCQEEKKRKDVDEISRNSAGKSLSSKDDKNECENNEEK